MHVWKDGTRLKIPSISLRTSFITPSLFTGFRASNFVPGRLELLVLEAGTRRFEKCPQFQANVRTRAPAGAAVLVRGLRTGQAVSVQKAEIRWQIKNSVGGEHIRSLRPRLQNCPGSAQQFCDIFIHWDIFLPPWNQDKKKLLKSLRYIFARMGVVNGLLPPDGCVSRQAANALNRDYFLIRGLIELRGKKKNKFLYLTCKDPLHSNLA